MYTYENPVVLRELPPEELDRLRANAQAWVWWSAQGPWYREQASTWVVTANRR